MNQVLQQVPTAALALLASLGGPVPGVQHDISLPESKHDVAVGAGARRIELELLGDGRLVAAGETLRDPGELEGYGGLRSWLEEQMAALMAEARPDSEGLAKRPEAELLVRADRAAPFREVQTIVSGSAADDVGFVPVWLATTGGRLELRPAIELDPVRDSGRRSVAVEVGLRLVEDGPLGERAIEYRVGPRNTRRVEDLYARFESLHALGPDSPVSIDAGAGVAVAEVVAVIDALHEAGFGAPHLALVPIEALSSSIQVPVARHARHDVVLAGVERPILEVAIDGSIRADGAMLRAPGEDVHRLRSWLRARASGMEQAPAPVVAQSLGDLPAGSLLLRADQSAPFAAVQEVLSECAIPTVRIWKLQLAALPLEASLPQGARTVAEGRFETPLPIGWSVPGGELPTVLEVELRVVEPGAAMPRGTGGADRGPDRKLAYQSGPYTFETLDEVRRSLASRHRQMPEFPAVLLAHEGVLVGDVIAALDAVRDAGIERCYFAGVPECSRAPGAMPGAPR